MTAHSDKTLTGTLSLEPNPCTTKPCLPGIAFALVTDDGVRYFLTRRGGFIMPSSAESNSLPAPGDKVVAGGSVQEEHDIAGNIFRTLEVTTLRSE